AEDRKVNSSGRRTEPTTLQNHKVILSTSECLRDAGDAAGRNCSVCRYQAQTESKSPNGLSRTRPNCGLTWLARAFLGRLAYTWPPATSQTQENDWVF